MRLKPADQIMVKITCLSEPELLSIFAQDVTIGQAGNTTTTQGSTMTNQYAYTVSTGGYVILPVVGRIHVGDMTCEEAAIAIENKVKELKIINDPEVTVRLMNARVTVIGSVKSAKTVNLTSERNTIIDGICYRRFPKHIICFSKSRNKHQRKQYNRQNFDKTDVRFSDALWSLTPGKNP